MEQNQTAGFAAENSKTVKLPQPIKRGDTEITEITIQEPNALALDGLEMSAVIRGNVNQLAVLLPRITELTELETKTLSYKNLAQLSMELVNFLSD